MQQVILPTDFSENSFHAALYTARLMGTQGVRYTLLHTYLDADPSISSWTGMADELFKAADQGMREWEARIRSTAEFQGAEIGAEVVYGPLPGLLNETGKSVRADLVAMGTLGRSGAGILGSNAAAVVKSSLFPVLVVPNKARLQGVKRVLFADDQRGVVPEDVRMLLHLLRHTGSDLLLAHVLRSKDAVPDEEVVALFDDLFHDVPHRFIAEEGKDVAGVIDFLAGKEQADLIAVLHRHSGFLEGLFRTSTAKRLALHTDIPLLVLQGGTAE